MGSQLPSLPEPVEPQESQQPDVEIERVDDTPEYDRGRAAPTPETYSAVDDEGADGRYGDKVQSRLKQLRHVYHEERRQKEAAQREREALVGYSQSLQREVEQLRGLVSSGESVLLDQARLRAEAQVQNAREAWMRAHDEGDAEALAKAQESLARAVSEHERMKSLRPSMPDQAQQTQGAQGQQAQPQGYVPHVPQAVPQMQTAQPTQPDQRTQAWIKEHSWWNQPGYEDATGYLQYVHSQLMQNGVYPQGPTADAYWGTVDQRLATTFPHLAGSSRGNAPNANGQAHNSPQTRNRPVTATSGNRTGSGPVKVRLTESQLRVAQKLGVTPEQYAREVLRMERQNGR